jgi:hypothetical protein
MLGDTIASSTVMGPFRRVAFRLDGAPFTMADAVLRAALTGQWPALETWLRHGAAAEGRANQEGSPLQAPDISAALRAFRYDRNLIAADEAEAWLSAWELSPDTWKAAIVRQLLRRFWPETAPQWAPTDEALAGRVWADLVCAGALERLATDLAERAAIVGDEWRDVAVDDAPLPPLPPWLGITASAETVRRLRQMETAYDACRSREVSPDKVRAAIAARPLDWMRFEAAQLALSSETMAAEAALRVREDGDSLADVAADVGRPLETWRGFLDSASSGLRSRLLGASEGALLGPLAEDEGYVLIHVLSRRPPQASDPEVWAHAEACVWMQVATRALEAVQWETPHARVTFG